MRVKFRLCLDANNKRVTRIFFVNEDGSLELVTQMSGWVGLDFDTMGNDKVSEIAAKVAEKIDDTKYIE